MGEAVLLALLVFSGLSIAYSGWMLMLVWGIVAGWFDAPTLSYAQGITITAIIAALYISSQIIFGMFREMLDN